MAGRRGKPPNRWGCKPSEDVCVGHDFPLICRHGCEGVKPHRCAEILNDESRWDSLRELAWIKAMLPAAEGE